MNYLARMLLFYGLIIWLLLAVSACGQSKNSRIIASTDDPTQPNTYLSSLDQTDSSFRKPLNKKPVPTKDGSLPPFIGTKTGTRIFQSNPEDITPKNYPEIIESFVFPNAEIKDVIKAMSTDLNINIIMDPSIANKKISIISYSPITVAEAYQAFLSALAVHGLTVVPSGSFIKIISKENALKSNIQVHTKQTALKTDQFITQIIKLKYISANSLEQKIKPFIDSKGVQSIIFYEPSNMVIISDHGLNIEKFQKIIKALDVPSKEDIFKVIPIKHAQAKQLSQIITNLLSGTTSGFSRYSSYRKSRNTKYQIQKDGINIQSLFHDERTNSIIVMGNKKGIAKVKKLVSQLDYYKDPELAGGIFVYKVKHGTAKELADTLNAVIGKAAPSSIGSAKGRKSPLSFRSKVYGGGSRFAMSNASKMQAVDTARSFKDVRIIAEENTNSLLIVSNKYNYETILGILNKVDISRNQVFIKTIIMELNTDKNKDWKIANYFFPKEGEGLARMGYGLTDLTDLTSFNGATLMFPLSLILGNHLNGIKGNTPINPLYIGKPGITNALQIPTLSSFVQFLQKNVGANILSTPQVMALDHQEAIVTINENIPVIGTLFNPSNQNASGVGSNISYKDVETALKITPHINPDVSSVRLQIEQKIDSIIKEANVPKKVQDAAVSIKKRTIKTNIALKDKETAVLGGLVKESNTKSEFKVPLLGDLPLVGWLFKNSETNKKKSNLIVFITPQIIRSANEHKNILSKKLDERITFIRQFIGDEDPYKNTIKNMKPNSSSNFSHDTTPSHSDPPARDTSPALDDDYPEQPIEPVETSEPIQSTEQPIEQAKPIEPTKPTEALEPKTEALEPAKPAEALEPLLPSSSSQGLEKKTTPIEEESNEEIYPLEGNPNSSWEEDNSGFSNKPPSTNHHQKGPTTF